ncbi:MAG: enoyl-CoA hydratase/isomerase family protein [Cyclobacteriaceae bacterium]|nr:enoyl-CoA hydratase/isomerase family protein [Cyclobacteriaceae bacterium]
MKYIEYHTANRVGFIILNRPEKRNALSYEMVAELKEAFSRAEADDQVKVVVLKAHGDAFCAGADLAYLQQLQQFSFDENVADSERLKDLLLQIYTLNKVVIAQVQGHALAGGCGLASVCDFIFAVPEARFGYTEVKIGFIPAIVMVFLLRKIGEAKSKALLLSGDQILAPAAQQIGLVNSVVEKDALEHEVNAFAQRLITTNSGEAMKTTKQMIASIQSLSLEESLTFASRMNAEARASDDCRKGIASFLNKQKLSW